MVVAYSKRVLEGRQKFRSHILNDLILSYIVKDPWLMDSPGHTSSCRERQSSERPRTPLSARLQALFVESRRLRIDCVAQTTEIAITRLERTSSQPQIGIPFKNLLPARSRIFPQKSVIATGIRAASLLGSSPNGNTRAARIPRVISPPSVSSDP